MNYYIFGAHPRGQTMGIYLEQLHSDWNNLGYLYDDEQTNPEAVGDVPVFKIQGEEELDVSARVYIATRGISFAHIREVLEEYGFAPDNIVPVDPVLDVKLRNEFVKEYFAQRGWEFRKIDDIDLPKVDIDSETGLIYVVKSAVDAPLAYDVPLKKYEAFIQAGRAIAESDLEGVTLFDSVGDSISDKNRQMCELTAMYWIWKNACTGEVIGLEHYRRRFILPEGWQSVITDGAADVILPVPLFVNPSIQGNYLFRHERAPWDSMLRNLERIHGKAVYEAAKDFYENTGCYSPCNMLIARNTAFADVCAFVFPVIFSVLEECGSIDDNYQNRYPGFLSERLITFFFYWKRDEYKVIYADKSFLS